MAVEFPIFVHSKDDKSIQRFLNLYEAQSYLEKTDVQNLEYDCWDSRGVFLRLIIQDPVWLKLEEDEGKAQHSLIKVLKDYAKELGVEFQSQNESEVTANDLFDEIADKRANYSKTMSLFQRFIRRF